MITVRTPKRRVHLGSSLIGPSTLMLRSSRPWMAGLSSSSPTMRHCLLCASSFVRRAPGRYVRIAVPTDAPLDGGWLVAQGFAPGDEVVVVAAGQLLAEEFRARIAVGEEVGE